MDLMDTAERNDTPESVIDKLMEDDLVPVMDATPTVPLVLLGAGYVDKVVESASSELTSEDISQTNSGSLFSGELSFVVIDAPSQEHEIYVCQTALKDSAQRFYKPDWKDVKSASTRESNIYKKMKSSLKSCFLSKQRKSNLTNSASPSSGESSFVEVDTLSQQIDKDICNPVQAVSTQEESKSKDSKSLSPCPEEGQTS
ncbi:hypothetical protein KUCAC02_029931 [Chaenocephalus aceratus]|uniref:Uncharacterized protein n=1 Tax=Chaenocephalus aceratus TaxID=36190 RepID=A0ACB9XJC1_CHAAC|nr:hypothetical protein KUCAC02_029931 [Chaenocephalus aceratus]